MEIRKAAVEILTLLREMRTSDYGSDFERARRDILRQKLDDSTYSLGDLHREVLSLLDECGTGSSNQLLAVDFSNYRGMYENGNLYKAYG